MRCRLTASMISVSRGAQAHQYIRLGKRAKGKETKAGGARSPGRRAVDVVFDRKPRGAELREVNRVGEVLQIAEKEPRRPLQRAALEEPVGRALLCARGGVREGRGGGGGERVGRAVGEGAERPVCEKVLRHGGGGREPDDASQSVADGAPEAPRRVGGVRGRRGGG